MSTWLAMLAIGAVSALMRVGPLLTDRRLPESVKWLAGLAGTSVIVGVAVRSVAGYADAGTPHATALAALAVGGGVAAAWTGRGILVVLVAGTCTYLVLAALVGGLR
jgi:branched-subunit amino acid transport protein